MTAARWGSLPIAVLALAGCHSLRVGSPQISRAPEIRCIVIVQTDKISVEIAALAVNACRDAIEEKRPAITEPTKP